MREEVGATEVCADHLVEVLNGCPAKGRALEHASVVHEGVDGPGRSRVGRVNLHGHPLGIREVEQCRAGMRAKSGAGLLGAREATRGNHDVCPGAQARFGGREPYARRAARDEHAPPREELAPTSQRLLNAHGAPEVGEDEAPGALGLCLESHVAPYPSLTPNLPAIFTAVSLPIVFFTMSLAARVASETASCGRERS